MVRIVPNLVTERIESVKAGLVGASAFATAELIAILFQATAVKAILQYNLTPIVLDGELLLQLSFGAVSGFLFGVTYRYIIRNDRNSHLNDGAVFAFGLIRGLALVENNLIWSKPIFLLSLVIKSIIYFAIARFTLDLAIARKLIKPFM